MTSLFSEFTQTLHALGSPDTLRRLAEENLAPPARPVVNAHIHLPPNFSAFETVRQALDLAEAQNVRVLGASNYYDYSVYGEFAAGAKVRGIFPLFGLEVIALDDDLRRAGVKVNDPGNPGKYYLCGKAITRLDPLPPEAQSLLQTIRDADSARMAAVTAKLREVFQQAGLDTGLDADAVKAGVARRHGAPPETIFLQERHATQAFQEALFEAAGTEERAALLGRAYGTPPEADVSDAAATQNELRSRLLKAGRAAYVPETFVDFSHAHRLVLALGGLPCYPALADGAAPRTGYETDPEALAADLRARGIVCAELIPTRNTPAVLTEYVHALRAAGLFVTAGTEHNTRDLLPLAPTCLGGADIPEAAAELFWEGACVLAAHQFLALSGEPGFVDGAGVPDPAYPTPDARIAAYAALGAAVLARYGAAP